MAEDGDRILTRRNDHPDMNSLELIPVMLLVRSGTAAITPAGGLQAMKAVLLEAELSFAIGSPNPGSRLCFSEPMALLYRAGRTVEHRMGPSSTGSLHRRRRQLRRRRPTEAADDERPAGRGGGVVWGEGARRGSSWGRAMM